MLAGGLDVVGIENLNVKGMANQQRQSGRPLADASLGELHRTFTYKTAERWSPSDGRLPVLSVAQDLFGVRCSESPTAAANPNFLLRALRCVSGPGRERRTQHRLLNSQFEQANHQIQRYCRQGRPETLNADSRLRKTQPGRPGGSSRPL